MPQFCFAADATETLRGRAYFTVEADTEAEAREMLVEDASDHFADFSETDGSTNWDAAKAEDFELL